VGRAHSGDDARLKITHKGAEGRLSNPLLYDTCVPGGRERQGGIRRAGAKDSGGIPPFRAFSKHWPSEWQFLVNRCGPSIAEPGLFQREGGNDGEHPVKTVLANYVVRYVRD